MTVLDALDTVEAIYFGAAVAIVWFFAAVRKIEMVKSSWHFLLNPRRLAAMLTITRSRRVTAWSVCLLLGLGGAIALTPSLSRPVAAQVNAAQSQTDVNLFISRGPDETYGTFLRRAEAIARVGVQQSFDFDLLLSEVSVTVVGESQGISVPLMDVRVTRQQWQERPDPQYWAVYYGTAPMLLDF